MSQNILDILLEKGLPSREVQVALSTAANESDVTQRYHESLNCNLNLEMDKEYVSQSNPVTTKIVAYDDTIATPPIESDGTLGSNGLLLFSGAAYIKRLNVSFRGGAIPYYIYLTDSATAVSNTPDLCVWMFALHNPNFPVSTPVVLELEMGITVLYGLSVWATTGSYYFAPEIGAWVPDPVAVSGTLFFMPVVEFL